MLLSSVPGNLFCFRVWCGEANPKMESDARTSQTGTIARFVFLLWKRREEKKEREDGTERREERGVRERERDRQ